MKILNFGSVNIDHVFQVDEIVRPGQTIDSYQVNCYPGGKGLNQSIALARAGAEVFHAGMIGPDGEALRELLEAEAVDCSFLRTVDESTGSAFIQVNQEGQNSIVIHGGANRENTRQNCDWVLSHFGEGDILLLQNEINEIRYLVERAYEKGMYVVLNPSPMNEAARACGLDKISLFVMNEDEAQGITGENQLGKVLEVMDTRYPDSQVVVTLGSQGAAYQSRGERVNQKAYPVKVEDTTAAGDTFTGYLLAAMAEGKEISRCLELASKAAAVAVTRKGASSSIPYRKEIDAWKGGLS